jgi:hypothetical protein
MASAGLAASELVFQPQDFGAKADGRADDTPAFRAMHRAIRRRQDSARHDTGGSVPQFEIRLRPGHYRYSWNRWTWGLRHVAVIGRDAMIQCTHPGPFDLDQAPLLSNRDHYWTWDPAGPAFGPPSAKPAENYGWRIRTTEPGDTSITLLAAADIPVLSWVLVQSYAQQQDGYPPNPRHFERARVMAIEGRRVRLDRPLRYLHRDDWPEDPSQPAAIGQARLVWIDRPDCPLALSQSFIGLSVVSNPNHAVRDYNIRRTREILGLSGTLRAEVEDCHLIALGVSQCGEVDITNTSLDYVEPDKVVDRLTMVDCTIGEIRECTGVNNLSLQSCTIVTSAQLLAREVSVQDCEFQAAGPAGHSPGALQLGGPVPTRRMSVTGCRFLGPDPITRSVWQRIALSAPGVRVLEDGTHLEATPGETCAALLAVLGEGWPVWVGATSGRCTAIRGRGRGAVFTFDPPALLRAGPLLRIPRLLHLAVCGCSFASPPARPDPPELSWCS